MGWNENTCDPRRLSVDKTSLESAPEVWATMIRLNGRPSTPAIDRATRSMALSGVAISRKEVFGEISETSSLATRQPTRAASERADFFVLLMTETMKCPRLFSKKASVDPTLPAPTTVTFSFLFLPGNYSS